MAKKPPPRAYPPEFRHMVLELARSGRGVAEISRQFDVWRQTIMNWMKQDDADSGKRPGLLTSDEREELTRLRRENKRLTLKQEILLKAPRPGSRARQTRFRGSSGFVKAYQADYSISMLCRVHNVSESGYYAWLQRKPSARTLADLALGDRIEAIHRQSRSAYGRPRIQAELKDDGIRTSEKRVARLMRERHCYGASRRKWITTTTRDRDAAVSSDLVKRDFTATLPNQLWVADIT